MRACGPLFRYGWLGGRLGRGGWIAKLGRVTMADEPNARQLGLPMTIALIVGNMIGAGIFLLPAQLAPFGPNAIYGWLLTIAGVMCLATVLMILSSRISG